MGQSTKKLSSPSDLTNKSRRRLRRAVTLSAAVVGVVSAHYAAKEAKAAPTHTWSLNASGNWSVAGNWNPVSTPTTGVGEILQFDGSSASSFTATNDLAITVNGLILNNSGAGNVTLANSATGGPSLTLVSSGGTAASINQIGSTASFIDLSFTTTSDVNIGGAGTGNLIFSTTAGNRNLTIGTNALNFSNASYNAFLGSKVIGVGGTITKSGAGVLTLSTSTSTFSGGVTLSAGGKLSISANSNTFTGTNFTSGSLGNGTFTINGGTFGGTTTLTVANRVVIAGDATFGESGTVGTGSITINGNASYASPLPSAVTLTAAANSQRSLTVNSALTVTGNVTETNGNTGITKLGTAILRLGSGESGNNTFTGLLDVQAGEVDLGKADRFNAIGGNATVGGTGSILKWLAGNQTIDTGSIIVNSGGSANLQNFYETIGVVAVSSGGTFSGTSGNLTVAGSTATAVSGTISVSTFVTGTGGIAFGGGGNVTGATTLNGNVSFTAVTGNSTFGPGNISMNGSRTFAIGDSTAATDMTVSALSVFGSATAGNTQTLTVTGDGTSNGNVTFTGNITNGNQGGNVAFTLNSPGATVLFAGNNTFTGQTNVLAGNLAISKLLSLTNSSAINLSSGGRLDVQVAGGNLTKLSIAGGGTGVVAGSFLRYSADQSAGVSPGTIFGTLEIAATQTNGTNTITLGAGSTLAFVSAVTANTTLPISALGNFTLDGRAAGTLASSVTANGGAGNTTVMTAIIAPAVTLTASGNLTDGTSKLAIVKTGNGTLTISGNGSAFSGGMSILQGNVSAATTNEVGSGNITIGDTGGSVDATLLTTNSLTIAGNVTAVAGSSNNTLAIKIGTFLGGNTTFGGAITLNNNLSLSGINNVSTFTTPGGVIINGGTTLTIDGIFANPTISKVSGTGNIALNLSDSSRNVIFGSTTPETAFTGNIVISGGHMQFNGAASTSASNIVINGGFAWTLSGNPYAFGNTPIAVSNTGQLRVYETGTTPFIAGGGNISLTNGGQLFIGGDNGLGSVTLGNITVNGGSFGSGTNTQGSGSNGNGGTGSGRGFTVTSNNIDILSSSVDYTLSPLTNNVHTLAFLGNTSIHGDTTFNLTAGNISLVQLSSLKDLSPSTNANVTFNVTSLGVETSAFTLGTGNTFGGTVTIGSGKLRVTGNTTASSLSASNTVILNGGTFLDLSSFLEAGGGSGNVNQLTSSLTIAGLSDGTGTPGTATVVGNTLGLTNQVGSGNPTTAGHVISIGNRTLTLGGNGSYAFSGAIIDRIGTGNNSLSVAKTGGGTQILSGANAYSGTTTVTAGTLLVNGTHTGGGSYTVNTAGTLGGNGTINAAVAIGSGGQITGGDDGTIGTLTVSKNTGSALTMTGTSNYVADVDLSTVAYTTPGGVTIYSSDTIAIQGNVTIGGSLELKLAGDPQGPVSPSKTIVIVLNDGTDAVNGTFTPSFMTGLFAYTVDYAFNADGGAVANDVAVTFTSVPEPTSLSMLGLGVGGLLARRRRKRTIAR